MKYFQDFPAADHAWLKDRFYTSLKDRTLITNTSNRHISVHVRLGDHPKYDPNAVKGGMQLPITWYTKVLERVLSESNWHGEIGICSDASADDLTSILRLPNTKLIRGKTAMDELIYLSRSELLIGSISTFSQWAAYLSGNPSIWHPQFNRRGGLGNGSEELVTDGDEANTEGWRRCISAAFHSKGVEASSSPRPLVGSSPN
jgi:hypothetical protein